MTSSSDLLPTHTETVIDEIRRERVRQESEEGFGAKHDDAHIDGELARAAAAYAVVDTQVGITVFSEYVPGAIRHSAQLVAHLWPWRPMLRWWKPKTPRRNLIRAAALLVAEIERLDRANPSSLWHGDTP